MSEYCTFFLEHIRDCMNPYCYYEQDAKRTCPIKADYIQKTKGIHMSFVPRNFAGERRGAS